MLRKYIKLELPSFLEYKDLLEQVNLSLLSVIADILYSNKKKRIVVSHTHQTVNNCLDAIHQQNPEIKLVKRKTKIKDLPSSVQTMRFYGVHFKKTKNKIAETTIIGMTILFSYSEFRP
jgi:hypothetical protein